MFYISQSGKYDCAFTCLSIMLANIHKDKNYLFIKHEDREYNFSELIKIGETYNTHFIGVKVTDTSEMDKCNSLPFIAVLNFDKKTKHSVIVKKVSKSKVFVYDPQFGNRTYQREEFLSKWSKYALLLKNYEKTMCDYSFPDYVDKKDKVILPIYQIIGSLSLLVGTYFINDQNKLYLPIVFFAIFIVFEILFRDRLLKALKSINESIFKNEIIKKNDSYEGAFRAIEEYKKTALILIPNIVCSLLIILFISTLLIMNNYYNTFYVLIALIFSCFEFFVKKPYFKNKEAKLIEVENTVINAENDYEFKFFYEKASSSANEIGLKQSLFKYVEIAVILIISILLMYLSKAKRITYIVFSLCVTIFLINNLSQMFNYAEQKDNFDSIKAKLINYIK